MRLSALLLLSTLLAGPASGADDTAKPTASSGDEIASLSLKGFDLASVKTFDFALAIGPCLVDLTMALGPIGILAVEEGGEPDVIADCRTAEVAGGSRWGGKTLSVTTVSLFDPRTQLMVWSGFDASPDKKTSAAMLQRVIERLVADRSAQARRGPSQ